MKHLSLLIVLVSTLLLINNVCSTAKECYIIANKTTNQFNLTSCSIQQTASYLSINMTYKVINDQRGAIANEIYHETWRGPIAYNRSDLHSYIQNITGDINHHNGQLIYSRLLISLNSTNFPQQDLYYLSNNLNYYHCQGHAYPVCTRENKFWTLLSFQIKRNNNLIVQHYQQQQQQQ